MAPQALGKEHLLYLAVYIIITVTTFTVAKHDLHTVEGHAIFVKIIAGFTLISIILNLAAKVRLGGPAYIIPKSFCGMTALLLSLFVLFGKPNMKVYHALWYMGLVGAITTLAYPGFLGQASSIFCFPTFTSLVYHSFMLMLVIALPLFEWFKPSLKELYILPIGIAIYIAIGYFEILVLGIEDAMCIKVPLLPNTILNAWFFLVAGPISAAIFNLIVIAIQKSKSE